MANPHKGEVEFKDSSEKTIYILRYSTNAICTLEKALDLSVDGMAKIMGDSAKLRMSDVRTLFWAGLVDRHPHFTEIDAGELMTDIGYKKSLDLIGLAFSQAFPDMEDKGKVHPQKPGESPDGTGQNSSSNGGSVGVPMKPSGQQLRESLLESSAPSRLV